MLVYRVDRMHLPPWLTGATVARWQGEQGDLLCLPQHVDLLPPAAASWVRIDSKTEVALVGDFAPSDWMRPVPWSCPVHCLDGMGHLWILPALLSPEGFPITDMRIVMSDDGSLQRAPIDAAHQLALDAAAWARAEINEHGDMHAADDVQATNSALAILAASYYICPLVVGKLGLLTISARREILRTAAGSMDPRKGDSDANDA